MRSRRWPQTAGEDTDVESLHGWALIGLFCGIGMLSHGLRRAGLNVVVVVDADEQCQCAIETNNDSIVVGQPLAKVSVYRDGLRQVRRVTSHHAFR